MLEEIDLSLWVSRAPADKRNFREAVHIILSTIGTSTALRSTIVMKGGLLLAKQAQPHAPHSRNVNTAER